MGVGVPASAHHTAEVEISFPYFQESGLYEYKIMGVMDDLDPEMCAQVYVDWEYRKVWDTYVLGEQNYLLTSLSSLSLLSVCSPE